MSRYRLAVVVSHPVQYHAPWFRGLATHPDLDVHVLFCHRATPGEQAGAGFDVEFDWDVPLLDGYPSTFLRNAARRPSVHTFAGLDAPELDRLVGGGRYDAVLVNGWHYKAAWQAIVAGWRRRIPVLARGDSHLRVPRGRRRRSVRRLLHRWFIPRFAACLAVGSWSREYFLHYGARPHRVFLVPHVVDEGRLGDQAARLIPERPRLRARWGLPGDAAVALFAGKFLERKRPLDFVGAVEAAAAQGAPIAGLMVGDGPLRAACQARARARDLPVSFTGFLNQSEIGAAYAAGSFLVLPSDGRETWGLVVNEAMWFGLPALVSDQVGCGPDLITPGVTGDIHPVSDVGALAAAMARWAEPGRCEAAGDAVRERSRRHSVARAVEGAVAALRAVVR